MMSNIQLTSEQSQILDIVSKKISSGEQETFICGAAGTGKTTMVQAIYDILKSSNTSKKISVGSPTNRASKVINNKLEGVRSRTIHKIINATPVQHNKEVIEKLKQDLITANEEGDNDQSTLILNKLNQITHDAFDCVAPESHCLSASDIIICDEASMISSKIRDTLLESGAQIVWIGDPNQLPPVKSKIWFESHKETTLTQIIRQDKDSGILKLASKLLHDKDIRISPLYHATKDCPDITWINAQQQTPQWDQLSNTHDKWIAWRNSTKTSDHKYHVNSLNDQYRTSIGINDISPRINEKLMVTSTFLTSVTNMLDWHRGEELTTISCSKKPTSDDNIVISRLKSQYRNSYDIVKSSGGILIDVIDEDGSVVKNVGVDPSILNILPLNLYIAALPETADRSLLLNVNYAYAVSCHQSQGGEWDNVCIFYDAFRGKSGGIDARRWLYTAVTRAKKHLTIVVI